MLPSEFHHKGVRFDNGYPSDGLAHILDSVMQHQGAFTLPENLGPARQGLLQIPTPTKEQSTVATESMRQALARVESRLAETVLA